MGQVQGISLGQADSCPLPVALEFRRRLFVRKEVGEEGKGNGWAATQKESSDTGSLVLRLLSLLQAGILGEVSGEDFS